MPISPIMRKFMQEHPMPAFGDGSIQEAREELYKIRKILNATAPTYDLTIKNAEIPTSYGNMPIRLYLAKGFEQAPTLIFFHGGGFVFGDLESVEITCREMAHFSRCTVISVDYPLAPEHPFPAAPESCFQATVWIAKHMRQWHLDPHRIFIGGSSAGATLTAVVTQMIRDQGGPTLQGQILLYPLMGSDFNTPSYLEYATGSNLTRKQCIYFLSTYCPDASSFHNPLVCPLHATTFTNLPRALVVTAECDPLRDDGNAYAKKLQEAGVGCDYKCYQGMIHGFATLPIDFREKTDVLNLIKSFLSAT